MPLTRPHTRWALLMAGVIDANQAKGIIPEYDGGIGTDAVHEESADLGHAVLKRAILAGDNIVMPKAGGSPDTVQELIGAPKDSGYNVELVLVDVPRDEARRRMQERCAETGRLIPAAITKCGVDGASKANEILKMKGVADGYAKIDNSPSPDRARGIAEDGSGIVPAELGRNGGNGPRPDEADPGRRGPGGSQAEAGAEPRQGLTPPQAVGRIETGGDVFINWSKIETTDDVKSAIRQLADADRETIDASEPEPGSRSPALRGGCVRRHRGSSGRTRATSC